MKGYQYLQNDFFELCKTRKINRIPMLLYIYLRGLYCRFQIPDFYWGDSEIEKHLGITHNTLVAARCYLRERGLIEFTSGTGKIKTCYTLLGTVLLPDLRVFKNDTQGIKNVRLGYQNLIPPINRVKNRVKNRVGNNKEIEKAILTEELKKQVKEIKARYHLNLKSI